MIAEFQSAENSITIRDDQQRAHGGRPSFKPQLHGLCLIHSRRSFHFHISKLSRNQTGCSPFSDMEVKLFRCPKTASEEQSDSLYMNVMTDHTKARYKALIARDSRFDGIFFVGVTSTGIYCRPICPVKPPKEVNCRFYNSAQEAEQAGFRPCLRCRPELAPGSAPVDNSQRIAHLIVQRIEEGTIDVKAALEAIAREFELNSRQIRRIIQKELGVPPIQLLLTRRLLLAKQLLTETKLPVTEIAFASGFSSLRRFNDAFSSRYGMPPSRLRKKAIQDVNTING